jgi:excisionase family DNA binding protein
MSMERHTQESIYELLQHDEYTPEEVSRLLGIGVDQVRHAVFTGRLPATVVGEDIVGIRREDVVDWYMAHHQR